MRFESKQEKIKKKESKVAYIGHDDEASKDPDSDSDDDADVNAIEWAKTGKRQINCPWVAKAKMEKFNFDVTKCDKIFDLLLKEKQLELPPNHVMPSGDELKRK